MCPHRTGVGWSSVWSTTTTWALRPPRCRTRSWCVLPSTWGTGAPATPSRSVGCRREAVSWSVPGSECAEPLSNRGTEAAWGGSAGYVLVVEESNERAVDLLLGGGERPFRDATA